MCAMVPISLRFPSCEGAEVTTPQKVNPWEYPASILHFPV